MRWMPAKRRTNNQHSYSSNILITKSGQAKLADFGVSSLLNDIEKRFSVVGTPYWSACHASHITIETDSCVCLFKDHVLTTLRPIVPPEVVDLKGWHTQGDIWSFGCTVIEMLTGVPPHFSYAEFFFALSFRFYRVHMTARAKD